MNKPPSDSDFRKVLADWQPEPPADAFPVILARYQRSRRRSFSWTYVAAAALLLSLALLWSNWPLQPAAEPPPQPQFEFPTSDLPSFTGRVPLADSPIDAVHGTSFILKKELAVPRPAGQIMSQADGCEPVDPSTQPDVLLALESRNLADELPIEITAPVEVQPVVWQGLPLVATDVYPARWLAQLRRVWKPAEALQIARVRHGDSDSERLFVRYETSWFSLTHETKVPRLSSDLPISLLNPQ